MKKKLIDLAHHVFAMRQAQKAFEKAKYSPDFNKRGELDRERRILQSQIDKKVMDILAEYDNFDIEDNG